MVVQALVTCDKSQKFLVGLVLQHPAEDLVVQELFRRDVDEVI